MSVAFEYGGIDRDPVRWVDQSVHQAPGTSGRVSEVLIAMPGEDAPAPATPGLEDQPGS